METQIPLYRSPLKYAGGKTAWIDKIRKETLEGDRRLVEPYVGGGSLFLNLSFSEYLLADINPCLINFYHNVKHNVDDVITEAQRLFTPENNNERRYYALRDRFNRDTTCPLEKAVLLLWLNRHCYNGLMRYSGTNVDNKDTAQV